VPRRKISEYRSKKMVNQALNLDYVGWEVVGDKVTELPEGNTFVVKVDQAIKQRFKRGLIYLDIEKENIHDKIKVLSEQGFSYLLIEPYHKHDIEQERYISLSRERSGVSLSYSRSGGVEIENSEDTVKTGIIETLDFSNVATETGLTVDQLNSLIELFNAQYMSFLEINPYIIEEDGAPKILDVAIEVDSAGELLADGWSEVDLRSPATKLTEEELAIRKLDNESPASFSLEVINPDGGIFLLLSGGGASVVIADEIFTMGYGEVLANYGEYSGNPSTYETELYTEQVVKLLLKSKATKKVALIGGAVANFTDIKNTFRGIINVLEKYGVNLQKQGVKFYVRRGGPRQAEGLRAINEALERLGILGGVYDPSVSIPAAVANLVKGIK